MTVAEIMEQAKTLSTQERKELVKLLVDTFDMPLSDQSEQELHWGQSLNHLLDELDTIEMKYPDIEDPVEWVNHLRMEQRKNRFDDEGENS